MRDSKKDKWLTTFGDLMALLFALFVLLISFSEINPETFEKHAAKMSSAFNQEVPIFKSKIKDAKFEINDVILSSFDCLSNSKVIFIL